MLLGANSKVYVYFFPEPVYCFLTKGTNNTNFNFDDFDGCYYLVLYEGGGVYQSLRSISSLQQSSAYGNMSQRLFYFFTDLQIFTDSTYNTVFYSGKYPMPAPIYYQPSFISTVSELTDEDNTKIRINQGSFEDSIQLKLYNHTTDSLLINDPLVMYDDYIEREDLSNPFSDLIYSIPYSAFKSFTLTKDNSYEWRLTYFNENDILSNVSIFFTPTVTQTVNEVTNNDINNNIEQTNSQLNQTNEKLDDINDSIQETNNQLSDLNDNITSDDISGVSADDLPSISINDPTEDGIGSIFTNLYNAFCTGNAQDIVFPLPFVNKNITLSPTYVQDMLHNHNADWVLTFIQAFWAYLFGRFIIKDMSRKISKIKSGNIEDLQETNIKEDML